jgi:hypothetical protein
MSVSDPGEKIEWGADSEPRKNERVPSSGTVSIYTASNVDGYIGCTEPVFVDPLRSPEIDSQLADPYDNPICCTGPPGNIG